LHQRHSWLGFATARDQENRNNDPNVKKSKNKLVLFFLRASQKHQRSAHPSEGSEFQRSGGTVPKGEVNDEGNIDRNTANSRTNPSWWTFGWMATLLIAEQERIDIKIDQFGTPCQCHFQKKQTSW